MARCELCGAEVAGRWFRRGPATWWKCRECGLIFVHPQPDDETLAELYRVAYYTSPSDYAPRTLSKWNDRAGMLEAVVSGPSRVLDVGCGQGQFLEMARVRGWAVWGLEVDRDAVASLPGSVRGRVAVGRLELAPFANGRFDVLTLYDVIEHVRRPVEFLRHARRLLRPGAHLAITTPDAGTLKARLFGRRWKYFDFERYLHLYHFDARTLERTLSAAGLHIVRWIRPRGVPLYVVARRD